VQESLYRLLFIVNGLLLNFHETTVAKNPKVCFLAPMGAAPCKADSGKMDYK